MKKKLIEERRHRELDNLANLPDAQIDISDIPERSLEDLKRGRRRDLFRPIKRPVTMRLDADILEWLKQQGPGYQTKVNQLLRAEMVMSEEKSSPAPQKLSNRDAKMENCELFGNAEAAPMRSVRIWNEPMTSAQVNMGTRIWESSGYSSTRTPSVQTPSARTPHYGEEAA